MNGLTCLDLFCGCGGFTLGMQRAGFDVLAAVDFNAEAVATLNVNLSDLEHPGLIPVKYALERDLTKFRPKELAALLGTGSVDVIVGGPPCQGFSTARQVDGANHGERLKDDPRRHLYREFLRYVEFFQPKVFVMENVLGIRSASGGEYFSRVQKEAREKGYRVHAQIEDCVTLGLPQKRRRQLFIGTRLDLPDYFRSTLKPAPRAPERTSLWEAIGDLPRVQAGGGEESTEYDLELRRRFQEKNDARYLLKVLEVTSAESLTSHRARPHSARDLRDFAKLKEGENSQEAIRRGVEFEFPYDKESFKDRYTRQHRNEPCSTIVAHLSKDGLMFIHPTQARSLTPREAARIQSFPDWFEFPFPRTHQFRLIGNAVPPLVSEAVGIAVMSYINKTSTTTTMKKLNTINFKLSPLPKTEPEAVQWLVPLLDLDKKRLRNVRDDEFKRAWYSIGFLYSGLHPDSALEHGTSISNDVEDYPELACVEPRLVKPFYEQSGWPVVLEDVAKEAWRRYENGRFKDNEFYCSEAQMAGMCHRSPDLEEAVRGEYGKNLPANA